MAGPFDFDVDTQIVDDLARAWDDLDNEAAAGGATLALSPATVAVAAQTAGTTLGTTSVVLTPASVVVAGQVLAPTAAVSLSSSPATVPVAGQALGISLGAIADPPSLAVSMAGSTATLTWSASPTGGVSTYDVFYRTPSTLAVFTPGTDTALTTGTTSPYVHSSLASGSHDWQVFGVVSAWSPLSLPNLLGWYDSSNAGSITSSGSPALVSQHNDLSGNSFHLTQGTGGSQPKTGASTKNGLNVIEVVSSDYLKYTSTNALPVPPLTIISAFKTAPSGDSHILSGANNAVGVYVNLNLFNVAKQGALLLLQTTTTSSTSTWYIVSFVLTTTTSDFYLNGSLNKSTTHANPTYSASGFGWGSGRPDGSFSSGAMQMAELIVCSTNLGGTDRAAAEAYLAAKWSI